ncbi:MAG: NAD(P)H-hydrate epimerase [Nitriliruptorales bacterium]|nr:NAD(P)H-hydrate epimerase [Nitriliruptorales bacterium]
MTHELLDQLAADVFWPRVSKALEAVPEEARRPPPDGRVGAVLVLLEQTDQGPSVVLTRRRRDLRSHPGQLSFPGGRVDEDEGVVEAALREAEEEIGLDAASVTILGQGTTFYIPPSKFWVAPVVARWERPHDLEPNPWEVDEVIHVPIAALLDEQRWRHVPLSDRGSTWAWQLDEDLLWGATAIVIALLMEVTLAGWNGGRRPEDMPDELAVRPWEDAPGWVRRVRLGDDLPERPQAEVPHVTADQMRRIDELLADRGVTLLQLAEHAGRAVAHASRRLLDGSLADVATTVLVGGGGNGAGGLVAARLLLAAGATVRVVLVATPRTSLQLDGLAGQVELLDLTAGGELPDGDPGDLVIDAMLGYGATPPLRGLVSRAADWLRRHDVPVVALDLPSGVHPDKGLSGLSVGADVTVTLAAPKLGLREPIVQPYVGDLYLADIGVPPSLWSAVGIEPITFERGPLVRLTAPGVSDAGTPDQASVPAT